MATTKPKKPAAKTAARVAPVAAQAVALVSVKVNEAARIKAGKFAGLAGTVQAIHELGTMAQVLIQGVQENQPVDALEWFAAEDLEPLK